MTWWEQAFILFIFLLAIRECRREYLEQRYGGKLRRDLNKRLEIGAIYHD